MSHLDEWAHLIAKQLKSESELVGARLKSDLYEDLARDTFIRVVLEPFLPSSYAIGSGRVIDASGNFSSPQDIVIYRRDYPQFNMPGSHDVFIYESVLATLQVGSKLVRKSFFNALDRCASLATLNPVIDPATLRAMASKMKMQLDAEQQYVHPDPLNTGRFNLIGRPQSFIYAFSGYQTSDRQLAENLTKWIDLYHQDHAALQMKSLPSVIATQGCFAWRNTVPFTIRSRVLMGVGIDHAPLRLIFLQLMHALNRRLQNTSDGYGIKSNIAPYLAQFEPPAFSEMVGTALNPSDEKPAPIHKPEPGPEAADKQTPAAAQAFAAATKNHATEKTPSMAERIASVSQPAAPSRAWANTLETRGDNGADAGQTADETQHEALDQQKRSSSTAAVSSVNVTPAEGTDDSPGSAIPETPAEQQAHLAEMQARPGPVDTESNNDPVIKDLSIPQPRQIDTTSMQPPHNASRTRPTSPLSLFNDGTEGDAEEYKFNPIEPPVPQSNVDDDRASTSEDDRFLSTQKMEATKSDDVGTEGDVSKDVKPASPSSAQDKEMDEEDSFIDTLVETAESLAEDTSKPAPRKPQYVTESLI